MLIKRHDARPFAFAGMWDKIVLKSGETVDAAAILTTVARGAAAVAHDRMPVILSPDRYASWLDSRSRYRDLLEPDADALELVPVSPLVNSVKNDSPECAQRV